jgi:hypothetical protein
MAFPFNVGLRSQEEVEVMMGLLGWDFIGLSEGAPGIMLSGNKMIWITIRHIVVKFIAWPSFK